MPLSISPETKAAVTQPFVPALWFGASAGIAGTLMGSVYATFKGVHAGLFSIVAGGQWFVLGSTFWYTRSTLLNQFASKPYAHRESLLYSTAAGSISGSVAGALRSRQHILPAAIVMSLVGFGGQAGVNVALSGYDITKERKPILQSLSESKWWPLRSLPDDEYEGILRDKIALIDAEMSSLDDRIAELRRQQTLSENDKR